MVRIPQHSEFGRLNDLNIFINDLEGVQRKISYWLVDIQECIGNGALAFEELTSERSKLSYNAFASLCHCIDQTIDGVFIGIIAGKEHVKLEAIDSSYWEITGPKEFEDLMRSKYGLYGS
jgi:hypothetical protein